MNPADFSIAPNATITSKPLSQPPTSAKKPNAPTAPRIDVEPLYTELKKSIGSHWADYKDAVRNFLQGKLNQAELSIRIEQYITCDPARERLHNQLICAIYGNVFRDATDERIATWVSTTDKPSLGSKTSVSDAAEARLKTEIMSLPARDRHRLKQINDEPVDIFARNMGIYHNERRMHIPTDIPAAAGGLAKTNWEPEIRKRYQQALFAESMEFPDSDSIYARMVPTCYEEGLTGGADSQCGQVMSVGTEAYIKEALMNILGRVRVNGEFYAQTKKYRRQLAREELAVDRGEIQRGPGGLLPVEIAEAARRPPLNLEDMRMALEIGDQFLGQVPLLANRVATSTFANLKEYEEERAIERRLRQAEEDLGARKALTNGVLFGKKDAPAVQEVDPIWVGGRREELDLLDGMLDECLAGG